MWGQSEDISEYDLSEQEQAALNLRLKLKSMADGNIISYPESPISRNIEQILCLPDSKIFQIFVWISLDDKIKVLCIVGKSKEQLVQPGHTYAAQIEDSSH